MTEFDAHELGFAASISAPPGVILNRAALPKSRGESYTGFGRLRASGEARRSITVESCDSPQTERCLRTQSGRNRPTVRRGHCGLQLRESR
jgi:hypothetical protein